MCLKRVTKNRFFRSIHPRKAYKIVLITGNGDVVTPFMKKSLAVDKWLKNESKEKIGVSDYHSEPPVYKPGFHTYITLQDAFTGLRHYDNDGDFYGVVPFIIEVMVNGIHTEGIDAGRVNVYVSKFMWISSSEVARIKGGRHLKSPAEQAIEDAIEDVAAL